MAFEYTYDEQSALAADKAASQLAEQGAYVGQFKRAWGIRSANTGTEGIEFEFEVPGSGSTTFSLYTFKEDGTAVFGKSFVDAFMFFFGLRGLKAEPGLVMKWDEAEGKRVEAEGDTYPTLCGKPIGLVLQEEKYTTGKGATASRLNLIGVYQPETRLMLTEVKEKKVKPVKLDRLLAQLKVKDSRKAAAEQPAQPPLGAIGGDY